jgi:protein SCO1/2
LSKQCFSAGSRTRSALIAFIIFTCASLVFTSCNNNSSQSTNQSQTQRYTLKGKIISIDKQTKEIVVDHEAIPGFMGAMAMPYPVKDAASLDQLAPGDEIRADLVVNNGQPVLENIVVTKKASGAPAPSGTGRVQPQPGEDVPDFKLVNQDGKRISLSQFKGKAVLLTFIYTRCPLPDYCPLMNTNFSLIEKSLRKNPSAFASTHLLSISFDSKNDTPRVLRTYGEGYLKSSGDNLFDHWEFAVASAGEMTEMGKFFGLVVKEDQGQIVHSMSTAIISPDGKIFRWYHGNDWKSPDVLNDLLKSVEGKTTASRLESERSISDGHPL